MCVLGENRVRRRCERRARLIRGATQRTEMGMVPALRRSAGIRGEARGGAVERGSRSRTVERLADKEREQRRGGERRDSPAPDAQLHQAGFSFPVPATALRTRRFSARPSGGSFTSAVPSR